MVKIYVDSKGMSCPGPITDLVKAYRSSVNGDEIELVATDPGVESDIKAWCSASGNELISMKKEGEVYTILIKVTAKK